MMPSTCESIAVRCRLNLEEGNSTVNTASRDRRCDRDCAEPRPDAPLWLAKQLFQNQPGEARASLDSGGGESGSVEAGLLMVLLEPFKLRHHHLARRDQRAPVRARVGACHEHLGKACARRLLFTRVTSSGGNHIADYLAGPRDALGRDAAAEGVTHQKSAALREQARVSGGRGANTRQKEHGGGEQRGGTHGNLPTLYPLLVNTLEAGSS